MKKYVLIGILVITVALALSAFTWASIRSTGSQVGQTQGLAIADKGERDSVSSAAGFRTPPMSSYAQSSAGSGAQTPHYYQYGPASAASSVRSSGSYLVVVGKWHDR